MKSHPFDTQLRNSKSNCLHQEKQDPFFYATKLLNLRGGEQEALLLLGHCWNPLFPDEMEKEKHQSCGGGAGRQARGSRVTGSLPEAQHKGGAVNWAWRSCLQECDGSAGGSLANYPTPREMGGRFVEDYHCKNKGQTVGATLVVKWVKCCLQGLWSHIGVLIWASAAPLTIQLLVKNFQNNWICSSYLGPCHLERPEWSP